MIINLESIGNIPSRLVIRDLGNLALIVDAVNWIRDELKAERLDPYSAEMATVNLVEAHQNYTRD